MIPPPAFAAESCRIAAALAVTDAQYGFAGKTGTTWRVLPDCSFSVTHFVGTTIAELRQQGRLAPEQQRLLIEMITRADIARLPAQMGEAVPVNARTVSLEYNGSVSVLAIGPGERDLALIQSAEPGDPRRRVIELLRVLQNTLGR
jgi:hypothetical protein